MATGDSLGTTGGEMDEGRTVLEPLFAQSANLKLGARVASNHTGVLRNDSPTVARTVRELALVVV